jgi:DNA-binding SARP family transcriptional activator/basic membrane lipoprotein Med (substrate-binding protein (PBP1-ABC) superfamily)
MEFKLLGPLEVAGERGPVSLGGSRARAVLALLLLHRNEVVAVDRIVDELWAGRPPKTAEQAVRVYVSQLRKALGEPQVLVTHGGGYLLGVEPGEVDVDRFAALRAEAGRLLETGDAAKAAETFDEALSLWRGSPLQDFAYEPFAQADVARLEELRLVTLEDRFEAQLATGRDSELVADLEQLVEAHPLRERLRGQLMLALYRSGRQADALETYRRGRRLLADELGLEPSDTLRRLESRILQRDPELELPDTSRGAERPAGKPLHRRRSAVLGLAAALVVVGAVTGALIAATGGHGQSRPSATSLRVAFVQSGQRNPTSSYLAGVDPIDGLRAAAGQFGIQARVLYGGNRTNGFLRTVAGAARKYNLVIVGATPNVKAVSRVTSRFPETRFFVADSVHDPAAAFAGQPNVTGANFDDRENGYLGGYLAGLMTHGREAVSAIGGIRIGVVRNLIDGFAAGARRARPGVRVLVDYAGSFVNQSACETAANRQIDRGSAVVFDVAGSCGFGAMQAAAIRRVWGLGVDSDLSYLGPQIVASVVKRFDRATEVAVRLFASGELPGGRDLRFDLSNNGIGLVGINDQVPPTVRAKVEALAAKLRARDQVRDSR